MACRGRARPAARGTAITESVGSLSAESSGAMEAAAATALCAVGSAFAGVLAPPRGDVLLAWMVINPFAPVPGPQPQGRTMRSFDTAVSRTSDQHTANGRALMS